MRTLLITSLFVMLLFTGAFAHDGALSLYTDITMSACSADLLTPYATADVSLMYVRDNGPEMGYAFEFIMYREHPEMAVNAITWSGAITVPNCADPFTICAAAAGACLGAGGENVIYLGTFSFIWLDFTTPPTFYIQVRENPEALPNPGVIISLCDDDDTPYLVQGGTFVFNGTCDPGVEPKSWSAIKDLYK